jgi:ribosomal-protein-alanine N-acetyltransferase
MQKAPPVLRTERLVISLPRPEDVDQLLAYGERNLKHHAPWSPPPPRLPLTTSMYRSLVEQIQTDYAAGTSVRLWLRLESTGKLVGAIGLNQIVLKAFRACYVGYHVDHAHEGRGYMTEGLSAVIRYAFDELQLHRIMANYMPHNERSSRLLERLGFEREGMARDYLFIKDRWEDHILASLTNRELADSAMLVKGAT